MSIYNMNRLFILFFTISLTACGAPSNKDIDQQIKTEIDSATKTSKTKDTWVDPYPEYCFQRVGQVSVDGNRDKPRRGEICDVYGTGAGGTERGSGTPARNTASLHIETPISRVRVHFLNLQHPS